MRWLNWIVVLLLTGAMKTAVASSFPAYTATYEAQVFGNTLVAQSTLSHEGGNTRMSLDAHLSGFMRILGRFEFNRESTFSTHDGYPRLVQTRSAQITPRRERRVETRFDWATNRAQGHISKKAFDLEVPRDTLDFLSSLYLTMQGLRTGSFDRTIAVKILERDRLREYSLLLQGTENVSTVLGPMRALRVVRKDDDSGVELTGWFAPTLNYLPVRLDYEADGNILQLELTHVEWHQPRAGNNAGRR